MACKIQVLRPNQKTSDLTSRAKRIGQSRLIKPIKILKDKSKEDKDGRGRLIKPILPINATPVIKVLKKLKVIK